MGTPEINRVDIQTLKEIEYRPYRMHHVAVLSLSLADRHFMLQVHPEGKLDMISTLVSGQAPFRTQLEEHLYSMHVPLPIDHGLLGSFRRVRMENNKFIEARRLFFSATVPKEMVKILQDQNFKGISIQGVRALSPDIFRRGIYQNVLIRHEMEYQAKLHKKPLETDPPHFLDADISDWRIREYLEHVPWVYPF